MSNINKILLPITIFLIGCSNVETRSNAKMNYSYDYNDISSKKIEWEDVFDIDKKFYLCYIYSQFCSHCENIKKEVISYALNIDHFYFVEFNQNVKISLDISSTIYCDNIECLSILGTPSLLAVLNKRIVDNISGEKAVIEYLAKICKT